MENKKVEILKIGSILPTKTIMIVNNGGKLFDHYVSILRKFESDYAFLKMEKSIDPKGYYGIEYPQLFRTLHNQSDTIKGVSDGEPLIGKSYTINNGSWHTSKVEKIIDDYIIITKNSVYAIHNLSDFRNKKIEDLGI